MQDHLKPLSYYAVASSDSLSQPQAPSAPRFLHKVIIVTASTDGIGLAIARRLLQEGAAVIISSRKKPNVDKALAHLKQYAFSPSHLQGMVAHVSIPEHRQTLVKLALQVSEQVHHNYSLTRQPKHIDAIVLNAAANPIYGPILDTTTSEAFQKIFDVNILASIEILKLCVPYMNVNSHPAVTFISSIAAYNSLENLGLYSVSKSSISGLVRALATELSQPPFAIRVNAVAPGIIKTRFSEKLWKSDNLPQQDEVPSQPIDPQILMRRFGTPEEIAGVVSFTLSDDASYITGETIVAAGGFRSRL